MPGFVQIMEFTSSNVDEVNALARQLQAEQGPKLLARRYILTEDRDRRGHYHAIVEFESYEDAMKNSQDAMTGKYAAKMTDLLGGPPAFHNLDVIEVMEFGG